MPLSIASLTASSSLPFGGNTSVTVSNTGTSGFASLYLQAPSETGQLFVGQTSGLNVRTNTQHPITFRTFADQTGVGTIPNSMQILASGTRDVQILAPLRCFGALSTFDNSVSIGSSLASSVNCLGVTGGATIGGTLAALGNVNINGILKAPQIRVTRTTTNDGITIQNGDGTEVAKFHNDFRCRMNGDTTVLGDLSCSGNTTISGNLTVSGKGPWFCAGRINSNTPGSILSNYGRTSFTLVRDSVGQVTITMAAAHPQGANYAVFVSSSRIFNTIENNGSGLGARTSTSFQISIRSDVSAWSDTNDITFMVV